MVAVLGTALVVSLVGLAASDAPIVFLLAGVIATGLLLRVLS